MSGSRVIFVSYNKADRAWAEWIAWILEEDGFEARIQAWDFRGNFVLEMDQAAKEAEQTVIVLSQDYLDAEYTHPEWAAAFAKDPKSENNKLIPIRVGDVTPTGLLAQIVYADLIGKDEDDAKQLLISRVRGIRGKPPVKPNFPGALTNRAKPAFPSAASTTPRIWNVPHARNPNFTGREPILDDLTKRLESGQHAALVQAIAGLGGIGKTQIALEYAYRRQKLYDVVWWVRAEESTTLDIDFAALADALGLPIKNLSERQAIIEAVRRWLDQNKGWLLIFDNADDPKSSGAYLPRNGQGHVIITSRNPAWGSLAQRLPVEVMTNAEARDFLVGGQASVDGRRAADLADELGCLPLALAHAKAYIDETGTSLGDYLNLFKEQRRKLLDEARALDYPVSVAATWKMSFAAAQARAASSNDLVAVCSFLAPDAVPINFFSTAGAQLPPALCMICRDKLAFNETIAALRRYSLVETSDRKLSFHRLVQAVVRDSLSELERKHWATIAAQLVNAVLPDDAWDARHWPAYEIALPHAIAVSGYLERYQILPEVAGRLRNQIGDYLRSRAKFDPAQEHLSIGLRLREQTLGADHPDIAASLYSLGWLHSDLGEHKRAEDLTRRSLEIREKALGPDHPDTAKSLNNLACLYQAQGQYPKAEPLYRRSLEIREKALGPDHPDTAKSLNNLAGLYRAQGQYPKAEPLYRRSLEIREKALGLDHPDTATGLNNLAGLYRAQGQYPKAEPLYHRSLEIREKALGPDHPDTATGLNNLAGLYQAQGQYPKAEPLYRRFLEICEKALGPDHPDTATGLNNLAGLYQAQGQYPKAEPLYRRALEICEKALGPDHPDTATGLNNLAALYQAQGQYPKAEPLYRRALEIREKALGPDHPDTATGLNNLAALYQAQGQYPKAEPLYRRALEICEKALGPDHPDTATGLNNLAGLYEKMRRKEEAEPLYRRALEITQRLLRVNPDDLVIAEHCEQIRLGVARTSARHPIRNDGKTGRNDPCPCGSGKKFKKCCMNNAPKHVKGSY